MRTRFKTLTVGLVLATAAMAGCSSTTGSSGAVQNAATASASSASSAASAAASSVASTAPAPSPDPVTPTVAPTEGPASPVASPTDSSSASESPQSPALGGAIAPNSDVCAKGLQYACGGIGASGVGTVFYASSTPFACGENMESTCNYLEVAPNGWNGKLVKCKGGCGGSTDKTSDRGTGGAGTGDGYFYCNGPGNGLVIPNASGTLIGTGYPNTSAMLTYCAGASNPAAEQVRGYTGGGMTDWSLPSLDELNALYYYTGRNAIGGFAASAYWSSSQANTYNARNQDFKDGSQNGEAKDTPGALRPVRAF